MTPRVARVCIAVSLALIALMTVGLWVRSYAGPRLFPKQAHGFNIAPSAQDRRVADQSIAALEQFFRNPPAHVESLNEEWVRFHTAYPEFVGWAKIDSPSVAYAPGLTRTDTMDLHYLGFTRDAVFKNGTVKIVLLVQSGHTTTGGAEVYYLVKGTSQSPARPGTDKVTRG